MTIRRRLLFFLTAACLAGAVLIALISAGESTLPADLTSPSTARAGVIITPNPMMPVMSVTFSISHSRPISRTAASAFSVSFRHLGQPVPRI